MNVYTSLEDDTQTFYNRTLLVRAVPELVHDKFGQQKPIKSNSTRKQTFRRYNALAINIVPLIEGVTPLGKDMTKTDVTATLSQFGDFVTVTDVATWTSRDKVLTEAAQVLGEQSGQSLDAVWRDILVAGTSVFCATDSAGATSTTRTDVDGIMNSVLLRKIIRQLKGQNAKFFTKMIKASANVSTFPVRASYWSIIHTDVEYDAEEITGFHTVDTYSAQQNTMPSEVGAFRNLRMVTSTQAKIFLGGGGGPTATNKQTGGKDDVYASLVFGMNAYGIVPLSGHSLENIVTPPGGPGDPLKQRSTSGWKAMTTAVILNDAFMTRIETAASA